MKSFAILCKVPTCGASFFLCRTRETWDLPSTINMEQFNVIVDSEMDYPILFIPKRCTTLATNCEISDNVLIDVNITSPDIEGNITRIYNGFCNVKLVGSYDVSLNNNSESPINDAVSFESNEIDDMPIILTEANDMSFPLLDNPSQVWIDPSRSPHVYNTYDTSSQERFSIYDSGSCVTVQQHNTYITQNLMCEYQDSNVFSYRNHPPHNESEYNKFKKVQESAMTQLDSNGNFYEEDDFQYGVFLSQLPEEIINEEVGKARDEQNHALKQLLSTNKRSISKQRKTIMFLGHNSKFGQTIQNISYSDPMVKCVDYKVDHEVVVEESSSPEPKKKKYQCDKCKQIFNKISSFRRHMVSDHTANAAQPAKEISFICTECGKKLKTQKKFENHCLGHGDPNLECQKCHKVYATKFTLRAHQKIHDRKYPCSRCIRSYNKLKELQTHLEKVHCLFTCMYENCPFETSYRSQLKRHQDNHLDTEPDSLLSDLYLQEDISGEEFDDETVTLKSADFKNETLEDFPVNNDNEERVRQADSVIAKVISNKVFLLNAKKARKQGLNIKICEVCQKKFDRASDLKRHLIEHIIKSTLAKSPVNKAGFLNILCEICQTESFTKIDKYKAHLREHAKLTLYQCTFCDKSFSDSSNFSKHKKVHGASYLQCDLCHRKFNSKKMLIQHMEYHRQNEPLECRLCRQTFHFQSSLKKHVKCVHNKRSSKFRCRFCDDNFGTLKDKWDHEWMMHHVRKLIADCRICGARFRKYHELKRHCVDEHAIDIPPARSLLRNKLDY